jgi:hypothetical protein
MHSFLTVTAAARREMLSGAGHSHRLTAPPGWVAPVASQLVMNRSYGRTERNPALSWKEWTADSQVIPTLIDIAGTCRPRTSGR